MRRIVTIPLFHDKVGLLRAARLAGMKTHGQDRNIFKNQDLSHTPYPQIVNFLLWNYAINENIAKVEDEIILLT